MTMTPEARREAIAKALKAYDEPGSSKEMIPLPYKDWKAGPYPVISVPVDAVLFNPRSHRIKSQLESHERRDVVRDDPFCDEAQAIVHDILAKTEGFDRLKANLEDSQQREAGVVTCDGLLVNANRRLAALRDLDRKYIRAALLPSDADEHAIDRLELELQVQKDFKEDYTFTNELIFIDELQRVHDYSEAGVAKALNWTASNDEKEIKKGADRVRQSVRLLALVRRIQGFSEGAIPLTFFDDHKQLVTDIDDKYEAKIDSDPATAERVRNSRILGLLADSRYRELRRIDDDGAVDRLVSRLGEKECLADDIEALTTPAEDGSGSEADDDADLLSGGEPKTVSAEPDLLAFVKVDRKSVV